MKKYLSIICVAIVATALSSCTKKYITENNNKTYFATVQPGDWKLTADGKADSVSLHAPEIDSYFNEKGATLVYFSFFKTVYEQIPEVYGNVAYSYFHYPGNLVLYAQLPNGGGPAPQTDPITVKLVLIDSN